MSLWSLHAQALRPDGRYARRRARRGCRPRRDANRRSACRGSSRTGQAGCPSGAASSVLICCLRSRAGRWPRGAAVVVQAVQFLGERAGSSGVAREKSSTTSLAISMRPAALRRGESRKPTSVAEMGGEVSIPAAASERAGRLRWAAKLAQADRCDGAVFIG